MTALMRRPILPLALALCLVISACGGRSDEESGGGEQNGTATTVPDGDTQAAGSFGTLEGTVCGPGDDTGATDQGVTDDAIKLGVLSDSNNDFTPGLLTELVDVSEAFVAWCNDAGGINGRPIDLTVRDTNMLEAARAVAEACSEDFMLVAGGAVFDGSIFEDRVACGLPEITGFHNADAAVSADLSLSPVARYDGYEAVGIYRLAAEALPESADHFGIISYASFGGAPSFTDTVPFATSSFMETVFATNFPTPPATVDNYRPYIEDMSSAGTRLFATYIPPESAVPFLNAVDEVGATLDGFLGNRSHYANSLIEGNDTLDTIPTWVEAVIWPFEMADENPPTQQFLDIMDGHISGWSGDPKALGVEAWSAWLLWAKSATACGSDLTRDCVMGQAEGEPSWDGGGLTAPQVLPVGDTPGGPMCVTVLRATADGFVYDEDFTQPTDRIFNCDEANLSPSR